MRTRTPHWKRALAVLLSMSLVLASVPAQAGKITRYVHTDHLGSVSAKTDSTGVVMMRRSFTPYGENEQAETDGPGYTGHYSDTGSGLVYMQQRYYDPEIGRFLSVDPVTFSPERPQFFNRYWYANGNPYKYKDPDGRCAAVVVCAGIFLGVITIAAFIHGVQGTQKALENTDYVMNENNSDVSSSESPSSSDGGRPATVPSGRRGEPIDVEDGTNEPTEINGRTYTDHAQGRMQGRGIPPSAVEEAIENGEATGSRDNTTRHTDGKNGVEVLTNADGDVITVKHVPRSD